MNTTRPSVLAHPLPATRSRRIAMASSAAHILIFVLSLTEQSFLRISSPLSSQSISTSEIATAVAPSVGTFLWLRSPLDAAFPSSRLPAPTTIDDATVVTGTAFFLTNDSVVTNWHVAAGNSMAETAAIQLSSGALINCSSLRVIGESRENDLVLLRYEPRNVSQLIAGLLVPRDEILVPPTGITHTSEIPVVGAPVVVIGSPLALAGTVSTGIVSGVRHSLGPATMIQITAPISSGSSGSPVLDDRGRVFGVATCSLVEGQQLNFALPLSALLTAPPYEHGISLSEWARNRVSDSELERARQLYAQSTARVLGRIRALLVKGAAADVRQETPYIEVPNGDLIDRAEIRSLISSLDQCLPDRLLPGATSPPVGHWSKAIQLVTEIGDAEYNAFIADATQAMRLGGIDRKHHKWVADLAMAHSEALRAAADALPADESVQWKLTEHLVDRAANACLTYYEASRRAADAAKEPPSVTAGMMRQWREDSLDTIASAPQEALRIITRLEQDNPAWARLGAWWYERSKATLAAGDISESVRSTQQAIALDVFPFWAMADDIEHAERPLESICRYLLLESKASPAELMPLVDCRHEWTLRFTGLDGPKLAHRRAIADQMADEVSSVLKAIADHGGEAGEAYVDRGARLVTELQRLSRQ